MSQKTSVIEEGSELVSGRERILREAERLFGERGYRGVSIRELAQACGMTNAALYYHFESKEDLFYQVALRYAERLARRLRAEADAAGEDLRARLVALARAYTEHLRHHQDAAHAFAEAKPALGRERVCALYRHFREHVLAVVADIIRAGQAEGQLRPVAPDLAAQAFLGLIGSLRSRLFQEEFAPQQVEQLVDIFLYGMAVEGGGHDGA